MNLILFLLSVETFASKTKINNNNNNNNKRERKLQNLIGLQIKAATFTPFFVIVGGLFS